MSETIYDYCRRCGRDNDGGTHTALEQAGHLDHKFKSISTEVIEARRKAHAKHGENSIERIAFTSPRWLPILIEEVGELAHEMTYDAGDEATVLTRARAELIDIMAVCAAAIDSIDQGRESE